MKRLLTIFLLSTVPVMLSAESAVEIRDPFDLHWSYSDCLNIDADVATFCTPGAEMKSALVQTNALNTRVIAMTDSDDAKFVVVIYDDMISDVRALQLQQEAVR